MPKSIVQRDPIIVKVGSSDPNIIVKDTPFWAPPKGLNLTARQSRVGNEYCRDVVNMVLDDGSLRSRYGTELLGDVSDDVMALIGFVTPGGIGYLIRTTQTELQQWGGTTWVTVATPFTGGPDDHFSFTLFGTQLIIANGVDKLFYYDLESSVSGFIDESVPAKHVTTFNGRIVVSNTVEVTNKPYRIRWSVKNNSFDWTGDGSGFEDLFGAAGGIVDIAHGVWPVSDDTALVVRETSVWVMGTTGVLLAPHRFSRLFAEVGTHYPRSVAAIPGGIMLVTRENVVALTPSEIRVVGDFVRHTLIGSIANKRGVNGFYDFERNEYRLAVDSTVWRYNFRDGGWTKDEYPFDVRHMTRVDVSNVGLAIDDLVGDIDDLVGTIDELVVASEVRGFFFVGL